MTTPYVKKYTNDEELQQDVNTLSRQGVDKENIYVLSHDDDRTKRVADNAGANKIGMKEMDMQSAVGNFFNKKGDELRNKLIEVGLSDVEADNYEEEMDKGKVLMIVTETNNVDRLLSDNM
ncbi:general stress protein [Sediminibacillus massiliensis]|uniref:general stress protein n=1 Tax=Sediminibacillus massiliensis TaxID=1926277 RepID=UPI0009888D90|nr:general stress protein [Sediminibacillus massiliensis]